MKKRKQILYIVVVLIIFIIIDRNLWMKDRAEKLFLWKSGTLLGDPINYNQDFEIDSSEITFKEYKNAEFWPKVAENRTHKFYFVGCYFGNLYLYDKSTGRMSTYEEK